MDSRYVVGGAVAVLAVLAVVFASGFGPALAGGNGEDIESFPTPTAGSGGDASGDGSSATSTQAYTLTVEEVEPCGRTCRDVTSRLTNEQASDGSDLTVYSRIYAENGTDGDVVWEGKEPVGDLEGGDSYTETRRVELSFSGAYTVKQHDGWITIETVVQSDERTVRFTQRRDVA